MVLACTERETHGKGKHGFRAIEIRLGNDRSKLDNRITHRTQRVGRGCLYPNNFSGDRDPVRATNINHKAVGDP